jgi:hypothetical protein
VLAHFDLYRISSSFVIFLTSYSMTIWSSLKLQKPGLHSPLESHPLTTIPHHIQVFPRSISHWQKNEMTTNLVVTMQLFYDSTLPHHNSMLHPHNSMLCPRNSVLRCHKIIPLLLSQVPLVLAPSKNVISTDAPTWSRTVQEQQTTSDVASAKEIQRATE